MMVIKVSENYEPEAFMAGHYEKDRDCEVEGEFAAGNYLVFIDFSWCQDYHFNFVLSAYAREKVVFTEL